AGADRLARLLVVVAQLVEAGGAAARALELDLSLAGEPAPKIGEPREPGGCREQAAADLSFRRQHGLAAAAQPLLAQPEAVLKDRAGDAGEPRLEDRVRQRPIGTVDQRVLAPLAAAKGEACAV